MKLSDKVRNHRVNPLARRRRCGEPPSRPDGARSISDSEQFDEDLYSGNNLHDKKSTFRPINLCHKRHDLIIYKDVLLFCLPNDKTA